MQGNNVLGLDVGEQRVGVALLRAEVQIPLPLSTLQRSAEDFWGQLRKLVEGNQVATIVIGLPRGLDGQETGQTQAVRSFAAELQEQLNLPIVWQDEALTSVKAEETLQASGKAYEKPDIDALAASLILTDYAATQTGVHL